MLYLLVIMVAAVRFGRGPSIFAAALSVAAYDFFFVEPYYTFAVSDLRHVLTFATMFAIGLVISALALRIRRQERAARAARAAHRRRCSRSRASSTACSTRARWPGRS